MTSPHSQAMLKVLCVAGILYGTTAAQEELPQTIVGCDYLDCPFGDGTPRYQWANCTLADKDYTAVGFSRIPLSSNSSWPGLSWLYGADQDSSVSPTFEKNFYLGAPPETNFSDVTACAIFFRNVSSGVGFQGSSRTSQGTCEDAMSRDCVAALNRQAAAVDIEGLSAKDACEKVKDDLLETVDSDCYLWARDRDWNNITAVRKCSKVAYSHTGLGANNPTSPVRTRRTQAHLARRKLHVQLLASLPQELQSHKG